MRYTALAAWGLTLAAGVAGCGTAASIHPLYTDADLEKPTLDARVEGEWINAPLDLYEAPEEKQDKGRWKITAPQAPDGPYSHYTVAVIGEKDDEVSTYDGRLVSIGGKLFFDASLTSHNKGQAVVAAPEGLWVVSTHVVGRVWLQQDSLRLALLKPEWVETHSANSLWHTYHRDFARDVLFTGSTEALRQFVARYADDREAFAYFIYLCRPYTDCTLRATEGELERLPDNDELLDFAARVYSARANHVRVLALRRHRADLKPDDAGLRIDLGEAAVLNREFVDARVAYAAAKALGVAAPATQAASADTTATNRAALGVVWSYFLQGQYAEVVKAAKDYHTRKDGPSAQPILLRYFSLIRLGRRTDAESLLKREARTFNGPADQHLLLLDAQGRLSDSDVYGERAFFRGLREIAGGHLDLARSQLKQAASNPGDSLIALAATIELERLGATPIKR